MVLDHLKIKWSKPLQRNQYLVIKTLCQDDEIIAIDTRFDSNVKG